MKSVPNQNIVKPSRRDAQKAMKDAQKAKEEAHQSARQELWTACERKDFSKIKILLIGPLDLKDALYYMADDSHEMDAEVARFLLRLGVDPNEVTPRYNQYCGREMLEILIEYGWDLQNLGPQLLIDKIDDHEWVEWTIRKGIDLNKPTRHNRYIRDHGFGSNSDPAGIGERDHTVGCLNLAARRGDIELFDYFVSHGADPLRSIALHRVSQCKDPKKTTLMISHLIDKYHMDPMADDKCGGLRWIYGLGGSDAMEEFGTPMRFAMVYKNDAAIEALFWYTAETEGGAEWAARKGNLPMLKMFLEAGENAGESAVSAIEYGRDEALKICIEFGARAEDYQHAVPDRMLQYITESEGSEAGAEGDEEEEEKKKEDTNSD